MAYSLLPWGHCPALTSAAAEQMLLQNPTRKSVAIQ